MATSHEMEQVSSTRPYALFEQNANLKDQNELLQREKDRRKNHPSIYKIGKIAGKARCLGVGLKTLVKFLILCLIVVAAFVTYSVTQLEQDSTLESLVSATSAKKTDQSQNTGYDMEIEVGSKQVYQDCKGQHLKQSFPDLDYTMLGYNILKGFPLADGHDPGFTYPIFKADYSAGYQSADCRFSIPSGLVVIPDISCITSFTSITIQNRYQFSKALSVYTQVSGGGWGFKFSASTGYKTSSSEMSSSESVHILSTAKCNYYFSKLVTEDAPNFDNVFIKWIHKLNKADMDSDLYFSFFETYGTHFATEVTFGARYTFEHKMSSKYYESERKKGVDVKASASFSGIFGLGKIKTEFSLSSSQEKKVSEFLENVETKTISVGAPPPENGRALAWASEVKTNPVPTLYKLVSIEELFTDRFMKTVGVDYNRIRKNIITQKMEYCLFLQKNGQIESCEDLVAGLELSNTRLFDHYNEKPASSIADCIDMCLQEINCEAVSFCTTCPSKNIDYKTCHLIKGDGKTLSARKTEEPDPLWQSNVFPGKIDSELKLTNVSVIGVVRGFETEEDKDADLSKCKELCIKDAYCSVYTFCNCTDQVSKCKMYSKELIVGLQTAPNVDTFYISNRLDGTTARNRTNTEK